jgi:hypothetical protein
MSTFSNVVLTETAYQMHKNIILYVQVTVSSSSASWLSLFHPFLFFFALLIDTSMTSSSVSVCNSETIGDYPACDSKTSVLMVDAAFAETVDLLHKLRRELH